LYPEAVELIIREQPWLGVAAPAGPGIGYGRGARPIDFMAEDGFVAPNGSNAREVLLKMEQWEAMKAGRRVAAAGRCRTYPLEIDMLGLQFHVSTQGVQQ